MRGQISHRNTKETSAPPPNLAPRKPKLPPNKDSLIIPLGHTLLPRKRARTRTRAHAHLPAPIHNRAARITAICGVARRAVELALQQSVMRVGAISADDFLVDDAGPDGGEREEDAHDSGRDDAEFVDVFDELEAGEEGFEALVQQHKKERGKDVYLE
jgi:hypothetical protein